MKEINFTVCDTETGSLNPEIGALCSFTLKKFRKNKNLTLFIKPRRGLKYEKKAMEINGLDKKFLRENGVTEKEAIKQILNFLDKKEKFTLIGQFIQFDISFLKELFKRNKLDFDDYFNYKSLDTSQIAMFLNLCGVREYESYSLPKMYKQEFGRNFAKAHTSLADVRATERLLERFIDAVRDIK